MRLPECTPNNRRPSHDQDLTLLVASTALTVAVGLPAWSAMHVPTQSSSVSPPSMLLSAVDQSNLLILIDDDDDEGGIVSRRQSDDDDDDDECDDDEGSCGASTASPAPAGSVAPPQNGLFGSGHTEGPGEVAIHTSPEML